MDKSDMYLFQRYTEMNKTVKKFRKKISISDSAIVLHNK